jgi:hypothetical protein
MRCSPLKYLKALEKREGQTLKTTGTVHRLVRPGLVRLF